MSQIVLLSSVRYAVCTNGIADLTHPASLLANDPEVSEECPRKRGRDDEDHTIGCSANHSGVHRHIPGPGGPEKRVRVLTGWERWAKESIVAGTRFHFMGLHGEVLRNIRIDLDGDHTAVSFDFQPAQETMPSLDDIKFFQEESADQGDGGGTELSYDPGEVRIHLVLRGGSDKPEQQTMDGNDLFRKFGDPVVLYETVAALRQELAPPGEFGDEYHFRLRVPLAGEGIGDGLLRLEVPSKSD